jgi:uncharacterized Ntn-hydrolase superfamily protein
VTYSIVARDPATGQLGVAAQSCYFALGSVLPWARAGIGAVATQSLVDPGYGPRCLDLLAAGVGSSDALARVRAADEDRENRQVGVVDANGSVAAFTGSRCIDEVGHAAGDGYSAQANMMAEPGVCRAMARAFETAEGTLAERLLAALVAAEEKGGDARGRLSAALLVVEATRHDHPWQGVLLDVRVDHSPDPLPELARLVRVGQAYQLSERAWELLDAGDAAAGLHAAEAGRALLPGEAEIVLSHLAALAAAHRLEEAAVEIRRLVGSQPGWGRVIRALVQGGFMPWPDDVTVDSLLPASAAERPGRAAD